MGYKKEEKKNLTWRTLPESDLLWIIEDGPNSWNERAVAEHGARQSENNKKQPSKDVVKKVTTKEVDDLFGEDKVGF